MALGGFSSSPFSGNVAQAIKRAAPPNSMAACGATVLMSSLIFPAWGGYGSGLVMVRLEGCAAHGFQLNIPVVCDYCAVVLRTVWASGAK